VTAITRPDLSVTLTSVYIGAGRVRTHVTHLQQGPKGPPTNESDAMFDGHAEEASKVRYRPEECLDDHVQRLLGWLQSLGHTVAIDLGDQATAVLQTAY
jgi:hypothetical protein